MTQQSQRVQDRSNGEVLKPKEVADFLAVSERTVIRMFRKGELPGRKVGIQWRCKRSDLDKFLSAT
jgi:excisionase family DNA binding protein